MKEKKVALLIETSRAYGRGLLEGIARYHQEARSNWSLFVEPSGLTDRPPDWFAQWNGDGVLARVSDQRTASLLSGLHIPTIDLRGIVPNLGVPFVGVDNRSVAKLAFEHFENRGFRSFGIVSTPEGYHHHLDERCRYFCSLVEEAAFECRVFRDTRFGNPRMNWEKQQQATVKWLRALPLPTAILCVNDLTARETIEACHRADLSVPDQVAVMGVDNDIYLCTLSTPPMTSVAVDAPAIGYKAAQLLDTMMRDKRNKVPLATLLPSREVVVRASTDIFAIDDPVITDALRYIREEACNGIRVDDVVARTPLCRTLLERRFKQSLNRTIHREILRIKLEQAQDLLRATDFPLEHIAEVAGFQSAVYLSQVFRRELRTAPGQWRKNNAVP
jgi:LacI family transcriptional regulator